MKFLHQAYIVPIVLLVTAPAFGQGVPLRYTWMLPKTVIDATIVYTFDSCKNNVAKIKIAPTLVARAIPDPLVGQLKVDTAPLQSFWVDKSISIQTFANSRIINSVGSTPTGQGAQIIGNILGGIVKIAGIAFGLPGGIGPAVAPPQPAPANYCADENTKDTGPWIVKTISGLKQSISDAQARLAAGEAEADQKKDTAAVTAAQTLITTLQEKLSLTIKATIDPGVSPIVVDVDNASASPPVPNDNDKIPATGLVASICPSQMQLTKTKWFNDAILKAPGDSCTAMPNLKTNVYLNFANAHSTMYDQPTSPGPYIQTKVKQDNTGAVQYRDVAYIPVSVWRGDMPASGTTPPKENDPEAPTNPFQINPPQMMVFGQFGVPQSLPLDTDAFKSLAWQVTFLEDGQITAATFSSKAWGANATSLFSTAASSANSIVTTATGSAETQASALQGQADLIYQTERLRTCQTTPASCPSK